MRRGEDFAEDTQLDIVKCAGTVGNTLGAHTIEMDGTKDL